MYRFYLLLYVNDIYLVYFIYVHHLDLIIINLSPVSFSFKVMVISFSSRWQSLLEGWLAIVGDFMDVGVCGGGVIIFVIIRFCSNRSFVRLRLMELVRFIVRVRVRVIIRFIFLSILIMIHHIFHPMLLFLIYLLLLLWAFLFEFCSVFYHRHRYQD